jgi:hypothetical protein
MAKREQRGNREKRKPKAEKPKPLPQTSSFSQQVGVATMKSGPWQEGAVVSIIQSIPNQRSRRGTTPRFSRAGFF